MEACFTNVSRNLPSQPVARLVGHDGAIQAVCFTCEFPIVCAEGRVGRAVEQSVGSLDVSHSHAHHPFESLRLTNDEDILALGQKTYSVKGRLKEISYSFTLN